MRKASLLAIASLAPCSLAPRGLQSLDQDGLLALRARLRAARRFREADEVLELLKGRLAPQGLVLEDLRDGWRLVPCRRACRAAASAASKAARRAAREALDASLRAENEEAAMDLG